MDGESLLLAIVYRLVYGRARDRLGKFYCEQSPEQIRAAPLAGLGPFAPALTENPEFAGAVQQAVEDALAGRRPKW